MPRIASASNGPDVTLTERGRSARWRKAYRIVAEVTMGTTEYGYAHPTLSLVAINASDPSDYIGKSDRTVEIRFQQSRVHGEPLSGHVPGHRGFLAQGNGQWSVAYAPKIVGCYVQWGSSREYLRKCIDLLDRAGEVMLPHRVQCDLMRMILGLRAIGVEIRIWNESVRLKRAERELLRRPEAA